MNDESKRTRKEATMTFGNKSAGLLMVRTLLWGKQTERQNGDLITVTCLIKEGRLAVQ
jgi:hypothetical protein